LVDDRDEPPDHHRREGAGDLYGASASLRSKVRRKTLKPTRKHELIKFLGASFKAFWRPACWSGWTLPILLRSPQRHRPA